MLVVHGIMLISILISTSNNQYRDVGVKSYQKLFSLHSYATILRNELLLLSSTRSLYYMLLYPIEKLWIYLDLYVMSPD